jgi:predicted helicase
MYTRFFRWASDRLKDDGIIAFITNRNFIDSRTMDGFRRIVTREFAEIWAVDLGGDVRVNPKLSGTKNNVFGIQTGVAISFFVKRKAVTGCRIFYARRPEMETKEDKLAFLDGSQLSDLAMEEVRPDPKANWLNLTHNDFDELLPFANKATKSAKSPAQQSAIFQIVSNGVTTQRDDWVYDVDRGTLVAKMRFMAASYERTRRNPSNPDRDAIKWDRELEKYMLNQTKKTFDESEICLAEYRPFHSEFMYRDRHFNGMSYLNSQLWPTRGGENRAIAIMGDSTGKPYFSLAIARIPDRNFVSPASGGTQQFARYRYTPDGARLDNITDWALDQFRAHYEAGAPSPLAGEGGRQSRPDEGLAQQGALKTKRGKSAEIGAGGSDPSSVVADATTPSPARGEGERPITKDAIFHYVYAVLHDPIYREKYAQNLKREFPRIPFYEDFWRWADWGETLMALHIGYETVEPWPLVRTDVADAKAAAAGLKPKPILRADHDHGIIVLDSETQLSGVPAEAWAYRLGNRSALEWRAMAETG